MIKVHLSAILGARRLSQSDLAQATGIRPNTINSLCYKFIDRVGLTEIDAICDVSDVFEYVPKHNDKGNSGRSNEMSDPIGRGCLVAMNTAELE